MPAELSARPVEVEEALRETSATVPIAIALHASDEQLADAQPEESLARKIFEGHEEFLGCTPD